MSKSLNQDLTFLSQPKHQMVKSSENGSKHAPNVYDLMVNNIIFRNGRLIADR